MRPGKLQMVALGAILAPAILGASPPSAGQDGDSLSLSAMRRVLRHFDFEEAQLAPHNMPINFYRHLATDRGFPRFGQMRLSDDEAASGRWSFRFDLEGGSMSARVPTAVLPALPDAAYVVSAKVRTSDLGHARAGIGVWLHDVTGKVIPASHMQSELVQTDDEWHSLQVRVSADAPDVSDIVVELQVLQPGHISAPQRHGAPQAQDVRGTVWFDDVVVRLVPRIDLDIAVGAVVIGTRLQLDASIRDLAREPMYGCLAVTDLDGRTVHEETFDVREPTVERAFALSLDRYGWYRATLELRDDHGPVGLRTLDFACVPETRVRRTDRDSATSALAVELPPSRSDATWSADAVALLDVDRVIAPVFTDRDARFDLAGTGGGVPSLKHIRRSGVDVIGSIDALPMAQRRGEPLHLDDPATWRDLVHRLMIDYGRVSESWRIGEAVVTGEPRQVEARVAALVRVLGEYGAKEVFVSAPPADEHNAGPATLEIARSARTEPVGTVITIRTAELPRLLIDALGAWRHGFDVVAIEAPWRVAPGAPQRVEPTPAFGAWRQLVGHLAGRRFAGTMKLTDGVECWMLLDEPGAPVTLVAWVRPDHADDTVVITADLGGSTRHRYDVFGNAEMVPKRDGVHELVVGRMPVFVE